jgi:tRNA threonylcarbamoyladenosine biosynthesis protein TsaE
MLSGIATTCPPTATRREGMAPVIAEKQTVNQPTMTHIHYRSESEDDTARLGAVLAELLPPGSVVALLGTLGAGKTRLVQAIAEGCGVQRRLVVSPTFVLIHEYAGRRMIYHIDAYRLKDDDEFLELGPEEYFESDGITLIEWADRVEDCLPHERLAIQIEVVGETAREFFLQATGSAYETVLTELAAALA